MREQSVAAGTEIVSQTVAKVDLASRPFKYWLHPIGDESEIEPEAHTADAIIVATGAKARRLGLTGEERYWGSGVSACAVCDGSLPMFRNNPLVVIGGGDSAVEESLYLAKKASHVTVLVRKGVLRASKINARRLLNHDKVDVLFDTVATEITGEGKEDGVMTGMKIKNVKTGKEEEIKANGLFYAVGHEPATLLFKGQLKMDEDNYLITEPGRGLTSVPGVFAAGDVQDKKYRQAVTSAGEQILTTSFVLTIRRIRLHCRVGSREISRRTGRRGPCRSGYFRQQAEQSELPRIQRKSAPVRVSGTLLGRSRVFQAVVTNGGSEISQKPTLRRIRTELRSK
jgi:thioredoxin reductase (NADPH)